MLSLDVKLNRGRFDLDAHLATDATVTGLFGHSGSGKSTLLNLIAGLVTPNTGRIRLDTDTLFDSRRSINLPPEKRRVGIVFQDSQLFPHLKVIANIRYGYALTPRRLRRFRPGEIIELLEIGHLLDSRPRHLSGGEKQRVGLARALLASPRLLLLDEPLSALDNGLKTQILPFLRRVRDELAIPMIYVSHALTEILQLTDHLAFVQNGRIVAAGAFHEIMLDPEVLHLAGPLGLDNVLQVKILYHDVPNGLTVAECGHSRIVLPLSRLPLAADAFVGVRAADIALTRRRIEGISIQNQIEGCVAGITPMDERVTVKIDTGGSPLLLEVTRKAFTDLALGIGDRAYCLIKSHSFSYLAEHGRNDAVARPEPSLSCFLPGMRTANSPETPTANEHSAG